MMEKYEITQSAASKGGIKFSGKFYRIRDVDKQIAMLESKISQLETKQENKKTANGPTIQAFRKYLLSGGCSNRNVRFYILNLIENFILREGK